MTKKDVRIIASAKLKIEAWRIENGLEARLEVIEKALRLVEECREKS